MKLNYINLVKEVENPEIKLIQEASGDKQELIINKLVFLKYEHGLSYGFNVNNK